MDVIDKTVMVLNDPTKDNEIQNYNKQDNFFSGHLGDESRKCLAEIDSPRTSKYRRVIRPKELQIDTRSTLRMMLYNSNEVD